MNISNRTILITGGGSGIGFQIAKLLGKRGNHIIITGRTEEKLKSAVSKLTNVSYIVSDITKEAEIDSLLNQLGDTPVDILINNAGNASMYDLTGSGAFEGAEAEITTNYLSIIRLTNKLLPKLTASTEGAIVNVSSIVAFAPSAVLAGYGASKAALHSYSQSLRHVLSKSSNVKVFELMPPLVNTEFSKEIGGENGMPPEGVAQALVDAFEQDQYEIHVGMTADFYKAYLSSPAEAFKMLNQ